SHRRLLAGDDSILVESLLKSRASRQRDDRRNANAGFPRGSLCLNVSQLAANRRVSLSATAVSSRNLTTQLESWAHVQMCVRTFPLPFPASGSASSGASAS